MAFPLLSAGNDGFPKAVALQIALSAFNAFLMDHETRVRLVVFDRDAFVLSEELFQSVRSYIDEHYVRERSREEYPAAGIAEVDRAFRERRRSLGTESMAPQAPLPRPAKAAPIKLAAAAAAL